MIKLEIQVPKKNKERLCQMKNTPKYKKPNNLLSKGQGKSYFKKRYIK